MIVKRGSKKIQNAEENERNEKKRTCATAIAVVDDDILPSTSDISRVLNSPGLHAHALVGDSRGRRFPAWRR